MIEKIALDSPRLLVHLTPLGKGLNGDRENLTPHFEDGPLSGGREPAAGQLLLLELAKPRAHLWKITGDPDVESSGLTGGQDRMPVWPGQRLQSSFDPRSIPLVRGAGKPYLPPTALAR